MLLFFVSVFVKRIINTHGNYNVSCFNFIKKNECLKQDQIRFFYCFLVTILVDERKFRVLIYKRIKTNEYLYLSVFLLIDFYTLFRERKTNVVDLFSFP